MRETAHWDASSSLMTSRENARTDILSRIEKGKAIRLTTINDWSDLENAKSQQAIWNDYNRHLLRLMFDSSMNSDEYIRVAEAAEKPASFYDSSLNSRVIYFRDSMEVQIQALAQLTERLDLYREPLDATGEYLSAQEARLPARPKTRGGPLPGPEDRVGKNQVFVVHGQDDGMKQAVARFIERLGLKAIILHEQPSASKTVIEKLEEYSNVGYVVVLLSPDDVGASQRSARELHPRPRQNVVFEMGFFVGKLTRGRVCAIVKDKVEIHSDIQGVVYIPMDDKGAWQFALTKELKRAGFEVSLDVLA